MSIVTKLIENANDEQKVLSILNARSKYFLDRAMKLAANEMQFDVIDKLNSLKNKYPSSVTDENEEIGEEIVIDYEKFPRGIEIKMINKNSDLFNLIHGALKNCGKIELCDSKNWKIVCWMPEDDFQKFTKNSEGIFSVKILSVPVKKIK